MAKGLIDNILDSIFDAEWTGRRGEKLTERELKLVNFFGRKGKSLRNLYIPKDNGETSEIDLVYITQKGIFVFESKNYSGWIFGDEGSKMWTASLPNGQKNRFYNPIKQNRTHLKWLRKCVGDEIPLFSIIVFSERCELKKVIIDSSDVKVIKRDRTYATVRTIWESHNDVISEQGVNDLFEKLQIYTNVDEAIKQAHIENINKKGKGHQTSVRDNNAEVQTGNSEETEKLCPKCGKPLALRVSKKGVHAGNQFYGCSGFPQCRYILPIDKNKYD